MLFRLGVFRTLIQFRCMFCGKEFDSVEECNECEETH